jgi:serine/alanine adding enzyme
MTSSFLSSNGLSIHQLSSVDASRWDAFAQSHERGTVYHLTHWRNLFNDVFGHDTYYLYARQKSGEIVGILPLVRLQSWLFGNFLVSMPHVNYGGAIGTDPDVENALMGEAHAIGCRLGCGHIEFRDTLHREGSWAVRTDKVIVELALPQSPKNLWSALGSKVRAQIRRPTKEGMRVVRGGKELLGDFYKVFARNMRDLGTPVYPLGLFARVLDTFPNSATIIAVKRGNQAVAAGLLLGFGNRLEIPWASSLVDFNRFGVNMLLYWEALTFAIETGYKIFDFGRSTRESGTYRFKVQWGGTEKQLYWHYWLRKRHDIPQLTPSSPRYKLAVEVWRRLPIFLANRLGPMIVKNLP